MTRKEVEAIQNRKSKSCTWDEVDALARALLAAMEAVAMVHHDDECKLRECPVRELLRAWEL